MGDGRRIESARFPMDPHDVPIDLIISVAHRMPTLGSVLAMVVAFAFVGKGTGFAASPVLRVDCSTLTGKVMCGYQGWFNCDDDGMGLKWTHWARDRNQPFAPGNVSVDLWPDMSETAADERYATGFQHADGRVAEVFSSSNRKTVLRHFKWMQEYGIDGVFVQRFANGLDRAANQRHKDLVLAHAREGAQRHGRAFAVMYDLSGMKAGSLERVMDDWRQQRTIVQSESYLHHRGRPLVAVWGIGFNDRHLSRDYSLADCRRLIEGLINSGCSVMLGVPTGWREQNRDSVQDAELHDLLSLADVISPWTPGRYRNPNEVARHGQQCWQPDMEWCHAKKIDYLPVVFPGFSWHNLKQGDSPLDQIPRLRGQFLWSQIITAKRSGAEMIYVAMFDEVDEATAIFKCTNDPPVGDGVGFLTTEGLPSDYYLQLVGHAGKVLRGETPGADEIPAKLRNSGPQKSGSQNAD